jgi:4-hydroxy-tetrahydrodipicolinate synthase
MLRGCYTALVTPMNRDGSLDFNGLHDLLEFQAENEIAGIVAVGTTGESPTVDWPEHLSIIAKAKTFANDDLLVIAGTGANCTKESIEGTRDAIDHGVDTLLLVDPYYNGPSSLEIRREYYEPLVEEFPGANFIPYIIPGRTGTMLLPEDLAILSEEYSNVIGVKEDPTILASGTISVVANVLPGAMVEMIEAQLDNDNARARKLAADLRPLMDIVTVKTEEDTPYGKVICKARNPLATKTLMNVLGMPSGPCRPPLGKMTRQGLMKMLEAARSVYDHRPDLFEPVEEFFEIDAGERLSSRDCWEGLYYDSY